MTNQNSGRNLDPDAILNRLQGLEQRLSDLEVKMNNISAHLPEYGAGKGYETADTAFPRKTTGVGNGVIIESKIGEYGLAWLGNIVLLFGIIFLAQYFINTGYPLISTLVGYLAVTGILILSWYLKKSFSYMSLLFSIFGQLLLYYITLRMHFFSDDPLIGNKGISIFLLLAVIGVQVFLAFRRKSETYAGIAMLLIIITSIISDTTHVMLSVVTLGAAGVVYMFYRFGWWRILILSIILTYFTLLIWIINNPLIGNTMQAVADHQYTYLYLSACAVIFSMATLIPNSGKFPENVVFSSVILNGIGFTNLLWLWVFVFFKDDYVWLFGSVALFCLFFSAVLKQYSPWKYSPALYALYGFVAVSIAIYGIYKFPDAFLLLTFQSLLVLSIALWYRSKIIVVMNVILLIILFFTFKVYSGSVNMINFSFPVVAFVSARVINWQKERLSIRTEIIRNTYLLILFFTMLYALFKAVPANYVTMSWAIVAVVYFLLSLLLKNTKYRWMAIANMIITAFYLFIVDLANISLVYRIVAFLFLAVISISLSIYYVRKVKDKQKEKA